MYNTMLATRSDPCKQRLVKDQRSTFGANVKLNFLSHFD